MIFEMQKRMYTDSPPRSSRPLRRRFFLVGNAFVLASAVQASNLMPGAHRYGTGNAAVSAPSAAMAPKARDNRTPRAQWEGRRDGALWTQVTHSAIAGHGHALIETVPRDIAEWRPAYPEVAASARAAFWVAMLSTHTRIESTYNPGAVDGDGSWFGLLQIEPSTAKLRNCRADTAQALLRGSANLSCSVRIVASTVPRDGVIAVKDNRRWRGVAADSQHGIAACHAALHAESVFCL